MLVGRRRRQSQDLVLLPLFVRRSAYDPPSSGDRAVDEAYDVLICHIRSPKEDPEPPFGVQIVPALRWDEVHDRLAELWHPESGFLAMPVFVAGHTIRVLVTDGEKEGCMH